VQKVFDALRQLFPNKSILALHHESKPAPGAFKTDAQRTRGSSNINAQTTTQFRIEALPKSKTEFSLRQTKARDAQKLDRFLLEMDIRHNEDQTTDVIGLIYKGEMLDAEDKMGKAREIIEEILGTSSMMTRKELIDICTAEGIGDKTTTRTIKVMSEEKVIDEVQKGKEKAYFLTNSVKTDSDQSESEDINNSGQDS
jgi:hypothetical protein